MQTLLGSTGTRYSDLTVSSHCVKSFFIALEFDKSMLYIKEH